MITIVNGCLLQAVLKNEVDVMVHQANCFHTFGAGIARYIRAQLPEAYIADLQTESGDVNKLGTISWVFSERHSCTFVNLYGQYSVSNVSMQTEYAAVVNGLKAVKQLVESIGDPTLRIGIPYGMGCGLGGGDWLIMEALIGYYLAGFNVVLYRLPLIKPATGSISALIK